MHMWVAEDGFLPLPLSHRQVVPGGACPTGGSFLEAPLSHRRVLGIKLGQRACVADSFICLGILSALHFKKS